MQHPTTVERFYLLDLARGIASLAVVVWHYQHFYSRGIYHWPLSGFVAANQPGYRILWPFYHHGYLAVQVFFVLSGFVFFSQYLDRIKAREVGAYKFFVLRFSRLYPLHFVTLIAVAVVQIAYKRTTGTFFIYPCNDAIHFVTNLLFIQNWGMEKCFSFNGPSWSVSVEVVLYIGFFVFAFLVIANVRTARIACTIAAIVGGLVLYKLTAGSVLFKLTGVAEAIICFYAGGLVFLMIEIFLKAKWNTWLLIVGSGTSLAISAIYLAMTGKHQQVVLDAVLFPTLILLLASTQCRMATLGRHVRLLGDISYSTYLLHFPLQILIVLVAAIGGIVTNYNSPLVFIGFFAALIGISAASYHLFERRAQSFLRRKFTTSVRQSGRPPQAITITD
jgi:peptidoglycan/LPS O-acetylase OafA/YrhL